jgi:hypothetical protein
MEPVETPPSGGLERMPMTGSTAKGGGVAPLTL